MSRFSRLTNASAAFSEMLKRFGVVTVMNAKVYDIDPDFDFEANNADQIAAHYNAPQAQSSLFRCRLDTLKVANVTQEGPTKTVTGGQYANPLIKYGKTARLEMQDALGNAEAVEALCGGLVEYSDQPLSTRIALHVGSDFAGAKLIMGDSFFIDERSGQQVPVTIMFYQFLPDSLFNLTQDAEGDATVFDMNGDLLTTNIKVGNREGQEVVHGVFYSVIEKVSESSTALYSVDSDYKITIADGYTATLDGVAVTSGVTAVSAGTAGLLIISNTETEPEVVLTTTIVHPAA